MKALSLWNPWPVSICGSAEIPNGLGKRLENRLRWSGCAYRGPLLLHAAKGHGTRVDFHDATDFMMRAAELKSPDGFAEAVYRNSSWSPSWVPDPRLPRGAIVGRCEVIGAFSKAWELDAYVRTLHVSGEEERRFKAWWMGGFALVLSNVARLETPIQWKGAQGFFEVPDSALEGATWRPVPV